MKATIYENHSFCARSKEEIEIENLVKVVKTTPSRLMQMMFDMTDAVSHWGYINHYPCTIYETAKFKIAVFEETYECGKRYEYLKLVK